MDPKSLITEACGALLNASGDASEGIELPNLNSWPDQVALSGDVVGCETYLLPEVFENDQDFPIVIRSDAEMKHRLIHPPYLCAR